MPSINRHAGNSWTVSSTGSSPIATHRGQLRAHFRHCKVRVGRRSGLCPVTNIENFSFRLHASVQEGSEQDVANPAADMDTEQFPFAIPKPPKFKPFVGQTDTARLLKAFQQQVDVEDGTLLIQPLSGGQLQPATDLLTESFADAVGYMPLYRGFLKKQVGVYLQSHIDIAPKAIILVAILLPEGAELDGNSPSTSLDSTEGNSLLPKHAESNGDSEQASEETVEPFQPAGNPLQAAAHPSLQNLLSSFDQAQNPENSPSRSGLSSDEQGSAVSSSMEGYSSFSSAKADRMQEASGNAGATEATDDSLQETYGGAERLELEAADSEAESLSGRGDRAGSLAASLRDDEDVQSFEQELEEYEQWENLLGQLVGTVELSFSASTRTPALTLNPPAEAAYLCNMAVAGEFQRRGYGTRLLEAAEQVVQLAGFRRVYLHVRLKDEPAKALYEKAGFAIEKEDCILAGLFNDRRRLLSKFIPRKEMPVLAEQTDTSEEEVFVSEF